MITNHKRAGLALGLGLGLGGALLVSSVFVSKSAEAGPMGFCSASSEISASGRQNAMVSVSPREPWICLRTKLGGFAPPGAPSCWQVAHMLGCMEVHDLN